VKIVELKSGITDKTGFSTVKMPEKYKLNDKDILFSWSGNPDTSIDTFIWALGEAWLNQHIFKVIPKPIITRNFLLSLLKSMRSVFAEIARDKQTTGLGHVTVKDLKRLMVALPSKELLAKFDDAVSAIINQQFNLVKQTQNLEKLRDTLLPKLLSGELELTNEELTDES
jgi:type I restriction enzyme S subunit